MRFFGEYDGLVWEFNSFKEWGDFQFSRFLGKLVAYIFLGLLGLLIWALLT